MFPYRYVRFAALCQSLTSFWGEGLQIYHGAHGGHGADSSMDTPCLCVSVVNILDAPPTLPAGRLKAGPVGRGMTGEVCPKAASYPGASPGYPGGGNFIHNKFDIE